MKLLIDQNISNRIIESISDIFPGSAHVKEANLSDASDEEIRAYAYSNKFALVTTISDFFDLNMVLENAPKIIYIKGNHVTTNKLEWAVRVNQEGIENFISENPATCLTINI
tara:strand:- start:23312 stop:23647 length:336 start_codon:yes stop_codon:yes gene_type:complete